MDHAQDDTTIYDRLGVPVTLSPTYQDAMRHMAETPVYAELARKWALSPAEDQMVREAVAEAAVRAGVAPPYL